jgi:predicted enzyme related to lactoylglutathione lyase
MTTVNEPSSQSLLGPLSWNLVYVDDLAKMRAFYEGTLGLVPRAACDEFANYRTGACTLELMARFDNAPVSSGELSDGGQNRVLMSFKVDDIEAVVDELRRRGAEPVRPISSTVSPAGEKPMGRLVQYKDPEGNVVELCDEELTA